MLEPRNAGKFAGVTLGEYLEKEKYSKFFADNYVVRGRLGGFGLAVRECLGRSVGLRVFFIFLLSCAVFFFCAFCTCAVKNTVHEARQINPLVN